MMTTIAVVTETFWPEINGVAMTLHRLVTGLAKRDYQVLLICPHLQQRDISCLPQNVLYHPVKGLPMPGYQDMKFGLPCGRHLAASWGETRPDIIYVATEGPLGWSAVKQANKLAIPVISGFHTNFHSYSKHYNLGFLESVVRRYLVGLHNKTKATMVPTAQQKALVEQMGIEQVSVLGRGVDTELFSPAKRSVNLRTQWGATDKDPVMIYVGRIAEEKNLDLTIRTFYSLRQKHQRLKFVLVGEGPLTQKLMQQHPEFIFAGPCTGEKLAAHYASGDVFVFASLTETFGNVILEAMASGLGVVAFDYAAARMHIQSGVNGMSATVGDEQGFINNAQNLLSDITLLNRVRGTAGNYALQHSWDTIVGQFEDLLQHHATASLNDWREHPRRAQQPN